MNEKSFGKEQRPEPIADGYELQRGKITLRGGEEVTIHYFTAAPGHPKGGTQLGEFHLVENPRVGEIPSAERRQEILDAVVGDTVADRYANLLWMARITSDPVLSADLTSTAFHIAAYGEGQQGPLPQEEAIAIFNEAFSPQINEEGEL